MGAVTNARSALLYPQFWFDKFTPPPPPEPRLTEGQEQNVRVLTAEIEWQNAEIERLKELVKHPPEKPGPMLLTEYAHGQGQKAHQEPASGNQRAGSTRARANTMLPTDPVKRRHFEAIVDTAWDMAQDQTRELERIEGLVRSDQRDAVFVAMQGFFHLKKPSQGVASGDEKIEAVARGKKLLVNDSRKHPGAG
jgi:hypothetical protein